MRGDCLDLTRPGKGAPRGSGGGGSLDLITVAVAMKPEGMKREGKAALMLNGRVPFSRIKGFPQLIDFLLCHVEDAKSAGKKGAQVRLTCLLTAVHLFAAARGCSWSIGHLHRQNFLQRSHLSFTRTLRECVSV